ncbi:SUKH-4 family immunity protein [Nocardia donostiensis]|uniref:SUKH-4 immunity protein of toxin-antitoxin system n=1 Tax=Nocardia donostiensis TaxID=1538463 RepID=A0A1V2TC69_9NOCA|nr:SUKH-4 family immunity protein [Nocardia donostiensis]ONM47122.1 hypothetical protein B0T46_19260 [Nocardia donostiensis]OQS15207.1 hypothetical protein B0T36_11240 [Nocardia donostiensis]OQS20107.1 hypothetical protein B0T44_11250 [Nocardia donostiensis]
MDRDAQRALEDLLARGLDSVAAAPREVRRPAPTTLQHWDLPARDIYALLRWGLPVAAHDPATELPAADFQVEADPQCPLPGPAEAAVLSGYRIAGSKRRWYAAATGGGGVFALGRPDASADGLVNTSVALYVETVWRWTLLSELIQPLEAAGEDETVYWCLERFAAWTVQRDPAAKMHADDGVSWWEGLTFS